MMGATLIIENMKYMLLIPHKPLQIMHKIHHTVSFFWDAYRFVDCMIQRELELPADGGDGPLCVSHVHWHRVPSILAIGVSCMPFRSLTPILGCNQRHLLSKYVEDFTALGVMILGRQQNDLDKQ
jgi:hypothetical protein